ncbi:MAG: hypothetical protein HOP19_15725 [Acidobacteria bacterium]|nr:hypothetical protein [Acidobacteriota bacterium]
MELKIHNQSQPLPPIGTATVGAATAAARALSADAQAVADKVSEAAHVVSERGTEAIKQAKQQVSEAYEQTSQRVSEQYGKAVEYGQENPGLTTLIAMGVGVAIGLLLASSVSALRSRVSS